MQANQAYIDRTGKIVLNVADYTGASRFSEGLAAIRSEEHCWGFIDKSGTVVIQPQFDMVGVFSDGLARVRTSEQSSFLPQEKGSAFSEELISIEVADLKSSFLLPESNFLPLAKIGYIDKSGRIVIEPIYDQAYDFSEGTAVARKGNNLFFIDKSGKEMISLGMAEVELEFSEEPKFSEGVIVACDTKTRKYGFMDKTGKFVIEPEFDNASSFSEGLARVSIIKNHIELVGFINHSGKYVIPPKFDIDGDFLRCATNFSEELASIIDGPPTMTKDASFMYIDKKGEVALHTKFYRAEPFHEGLAVVWDAESDKYGFIDKSGKLVIPLHYQDADNFSDGLALVAY